ncbi:MAG: adenylate kinase [Anaerolineae bacterium]|nr:adenylate kinase [Anaerolineae bacterium]
MAQRYVVVGTSGSGKTTLAREISVALDIPHVELDALHWGPDWTPVPFDVFRARTAEALSGEAWSVDGNYSKVRGLVWGRADTLVWLDYPLPIVLARVVRRTVSRSLTGEELWSGNRESLRRALFDRDSILLWVLQTYWRRRQEYPILLAQPEYVHLGVVCLRSPRAARAWLAGLRPPQTQLPNSS